MLANVVWKWKADDCPQETGSSTCRSLPQEASAEQWHSLPHNSVECGFFHIIASFAEFERAVIAERVRAGLAHAKAQGKVLGRPERTPGARVRIVALRQQGLSLRAIAQREGYSPAGVWQILRRTHAPGEHGHAACQRYRVPPPEGPSDIP